MNTGTKIVILSILASIMAAAGIEAAELEDRGVEAFRQGRFRQASLDYRGYVTTAPQLEPVLETDQPLIWCTALLKEGDLAAGCGNDSSVIRFSGDGTIAEHVSLGGVGITSLLPLPDGGLLAGGAPNGSVYIFDETGYRRLAGTGARYVWCMIRRGDEILAGTGPGGRVLRLDEAGEAPPEVVAEMEEAHVLSMAVGRDGTLYLGVSETGTIYAVPPAGAPPRILARLTREDVRGLLVDENGALVAVAAGDAPAESASGDAGEETAERSRETSASSTEAAPAATGSGLEHESVEAEDRSSDNGPDSGPENGESEGAPAISGVTGEGAGAVYEIGMDGRVSVLAEFEEMILSAALCEDGKILAGGAEKGRLYRIDRRGNVVYIGRIGSESIMDIRPLPGGRYLLSGGNPGTVWKLETGIAGAGTFTSRVLDAGSHAVWGTIDWVGWKPGKSGIGARTRSGHKPRPDEGWSDWSGVGDGPGSPVQSPPARYFQYRLDLTGDGDDSPSVYRVSVSYRKPNQAPRVTKCSVNFPLPGPPGGENGDGAPPYMAEINWEATDANEDPLLFDLRLMGDRYGLQHSLTGDSIGQTTYSWDSRGIPDGWYRFGVTASDRQRWGVEDALTGELLSAPFVIDNTPPELTLEQQYDDGVWTVSAYCEDSLSIIHGARVSLDGGDWETVIPVDGLFDHRRETIRWSSRERPEFEPGDSAGHSLMIQCWDEHGNTAAAGSVLTAGE